MSLTANMDKAGRIVIPKALRDDLRLRSGDTLELESQGDRFVATPVRPVPRLEKVDGILVFDSGLPADFDIVEEIREMREARDRHNGGEDL